MRFNRFLHLIAFSGKAHRGSPASGGVTTKMLDAGAPSQAKRTPDFGRYLPLSGGGRGASFRLSAHAREKSACRIIALPFVRDPVTRHPGSGSHHTLPSAPTAQLIRSGLTPESCPAINTVGTGASAAPKSSGLHSGLHRPGPDLSPTASVPWPSSWTGALANLSPHYAPSGRRTGRASLLHAMGVSGRAVEDLSLVDCGGLRFLAEGGAARPSLLRPLPGAGRPVRIRRRIRGREEDGVI